jgi:hypothetical protein
MPAVLAVLTNNPDDDDQREEPPFDVLSVRADKKRHPRDPEDGVGDPLLRRHLSTGAPSFAGTGLIHPTSLASHASLVSLDIFVSRPLAATKKTSALEAPVCSAWGR